MKKLPFPMRTLVHLYVIFVFAGAVFNCIASNASDDRYRTWFEWGDYDMLADSLAPVLAGQSDSLNPQTAAQYYSYCAMAFFKSGKTGEAQKHFFRAMELDTGLNIDPHYISEPMKRFCIEQRELFYRQLLQKAAQDSTERARSQAFEQNLRTIKKQASRSARTTDAVIGITLLAAGGGAAAATLYEYYTTKDAYRQFREHAATGRKRGYDSLLPVVQRANRNILIGGLGAVLNVSGGCVFMIRAVAGHRGEHGNK